MTSAWVEGGGDSGLRRNRKNENTNDHFKGKSPPIPTPISMSFPRKREPPYSRQHICHSRESGNLKLHLSSNNNLLPRKLEPPYSHPYKHVIPAKAGTSLSPPTYLSFPRKREPQTPYTIQQQSITAQAGISLFPPL
jgi:hypothetical protein